ncbi:hypothetical protein [Nucisporomicrobium flavum]|uniref:hypothetical protein n=1 Tax=Nucisporomicrobium flavum TaxID=2785915 RepID=UPI0018F79EEF|nr:hypothetical protein [Nucisporomicrobium flavum]
MKRGTVRRWAAALAVPVLLGACATTAEDAGAPEPVKTPTPTPTLVLRIQRTGGLAGPAVEPGRVPALSAYADGRVITPGPQIAVYPPPALPALQVQDVGMDTVARLAVNAVAAGVQPQSDFGDPGVADATTTVVTAVTGNGVHRVRVPALIEASLRDPDLTAAQRTARKRLKDFIERARRLPANDRLPEPEPYRSDSLAALVRPYAPTGEAPPSPAPAHRWPGPPLPGSAVASGGGLSCTVVTAAEADRVREAATHASVLTPWRSAGRLWDVTFRPLLPDEHTCADLPGF